MKIAQLDESEDVPTLISMSVKVVGSLDPKHDKYTYGTTDCAGSASYVVCSTERGSSGSHLFAIHLLLIAWHVKDLLLKSPTERDDGLAAV